MCSPSPRALSAFRPRANEGIRLTIPVGGSARNQETCSSTEQCDVEQHNNSVCVIESCPSVGQCVLPYYSLYLSWEKKGDAADESYKYLSTDESESIAPAPTQKVVFDVAAHTVAGRNEKRYEMKIDNELVPNERY